MTDIASYLLVTVGAIIDSPPIVIIGVVVGIYGIYADIQQFKTYIGNIQRQQIPNYDEPELPVGPSVPVTPPTYQPPTYQPRPLPPSPPQQIGRFTEGGWPTYSRSYDNDGNEIDGLTGDRIK